MLREKLSTCLHIYHFWCSHPLCRHRFLSGIIFLFAWIMSTNISYNLDMLVMNCFRFKHLKKSLVFFVFGRYFFWIEYSRLIVFSFATLKILLLLSSFKKYLFILLYRVLKVASGTLLWHVGSFCCGGQVSLLILYGLPRCRLSSCGVCMGSLLAPLHVGYYFPKQGLNLSPLHWKADS